MDDPAELKLIEQQLAAAEAKSGEDQRRIKACLFNDHARLGADVLRRLAVQFTKGRAGTGLSKPPLDEGLRLTCDWLRRVRIA